MVEPLLVIERDELLTLERSLTLEWLEVDGLGGYASSTVLLCPTRRYHGLLVAPFPGTVERHVFVSRFEETIAGGDKSFPLSLGRYPGTFAPRGHKSMERFELRPYPRTVFKIGNAEIERDVLMVRGQPTTLVRYRVESAREDIVLSIRPLLPCRRAHDLTFENLALNPRVARIPGGIGCRPYRALPAVHVTVGIAADGPAPAVGFEADPVWFRRIEYPREVARGFDGVEDNFSPGTLRIPFLPGRDVVVAVTIAEPVADPVALYEAERARRERAAGEVARDLRSLLQLSGEAFIQRAPDGRTGVCAGFPWFSEWGRDTFIALPGLTLCGQRGGVATCREVLHGALPFLQDGLLPNVFGTSPQDSQYGSVDAALWFARAVRAYQLALGTGAEILDDFLPALRAIALGYAAGTGAAAQALGIYADETGMIVAGRPDLNPTWMDAVASGEPVTPRHGSAVEIGALYCFLLKYLETLCEGRGDRRETARWRVLRRKVGRAFVDRMWIEERRYLADVWRDGVRDERVRPNMVIAAALEWSPLTRGQRTDIVGRAEVELLTPRGLRTLGPLDPAYVGRYTGGPQERDRAYHQGTVWPWLVGFYCEAYLRAFGHKPGRVQRLRRLLDGFAPELRCRGLLHVSEVFDGDPPHAPGGTIAQAWSTAELLRAHRLLDGGVS